MQMPSWLSEASPSDLSRRVQRLPLERLALGQRTLSAYRQALLLILAVLLVNTFLLSRSGSGPTGGLLGVLIILVGLIVASALPAPTLLRRAWQDAQKDPAAHSFEQCSHLTQHWLRWTVVSNIFIAGLAWLPLMLISGGTSRSAGGLGLSFPYIYLLMLPTSTLIQLSSVYRGLLGLLKGTGRPAEQTTRRAGLLAGLLRPALSGGSR